MLDFMKSLLEKLSRAELEVLTIELGSKSSVADFLDVNRSSLSRWCKKEFLPDIDNRIRITSLVLVLQRLHKVFEPKTAKKWLEGINAHLANQRPVDLIKQGRIAEVLAAIEQTDLGAYS